MPARDLLDGLVTEPQAFYEFDPGLEGRWDLVGVRLAKALDAGLRVFYASGGIWVTAPSIGIANDLVSARWGRGHHCAWEHSIADITRMFGPSEPSIEVPEGAH